MASASIPLTNVRNGYTIVTQVIPSLTAPTAVETNSCQTVSQQQKFLKGEPKALGVVEIMNGIVMLLMGIVMMDYSLPRFVAYGFSFWGSFLHILGGSLTVSASNKLNRCVVKATMVVNILSAITAVLSVIALSLDLLSSCSRYSYRASTHTCGISSVLLVLTLLQFAVSISVSVFTCKVKCSNEPTLNIINMVPNPETYLPVNTSFPSHLGDNTTNAAAMNNLPEGQPPAYSEIKID